MKRMKRPRQRQRAARRTRLKSLGDGGHFSTDRRTTMLSPPPSPNYNEDQPVIPTDDFGMIAADEPILSNDLALVKERRQRQSRKYVSKHFKAAKGKEKEKATAASSAVTTPPCTPAKLTTLTQINIEDLSSDSTLTDVPSDIGPDPFDSPPPKPSKLKGVKVKRPKKSPYFEHKHRPQFLSCLPFPPLSDPTFGLMQERLAHNPFRLLIATIFLNRTRGEQAMPVFYQLMERYPTIEALAEAEVSDVTAIIQRLGFQNQRARKCVEMAKTWLERPPVRNKRIRKMHYPGKGDGRDIAADEVVADKDPRVAWEISHLPGLGPYSHDSWRMFCRDELRGLASSWLGDGAADPDFEPEWKRVVPMDKELRAYLTWAWLKEGWTWNKETGERAKADEELMKQARGGGVVKEEADQQHLIVTAASAGPQPGKAVEKPAGEFIPSEREHDRGDLGGSNASGR